jgi:hypothetical protein
MSSPTPFEPLGERARWRIAYELLLTKGVGDVLTYTEAGVALGLHPKEDRHTLGDAIRKGARELLLVNDHAVENVPNVGYRVIEANRHLVLASKRQRRARREITRGRELSEHVEWASLTPEERTFQEVAIRAFSVQGEMIRRLDVRQRQLADVMKAVVHRQERTDGEVTALRERLRRLEERDAERRRAAGEEVAPPEEPTVDEVPPVPDDGENGN